MVTSRGRGTFSAFAVVLAFALGPSRQLAILQRRRPVLSRARGRHQTGGSDPGTLSPATPFFHVARSLPAGPQSAQPVPSRNPSSTSLTAPSAVPDRRWSPESPATDDRCSNPSNRINAPLANMREVCDSPPANRSPSSRSDRTCDRGTRRGPNVEPTQTFDRAHAVGTWRMCILCLGAALTRDHVQTIETRRDKCSGVGFREKVTRKLLDGELVEWLVRVERVDDVIAVGSGWF